MPDGYGNVRVSFGSSSRNVTQGDKDNAAITVYFNGNQVEKNGNVFEDRVTIGTRLTITAEAVSGGRVIGKGEETITVRDGTNDVQMKIYTYDNFVVTIDGKATGWTNFSDAWNAADGKTATIKMNADATNASVTLNNGNVTLDLNGHTITGNGNSVVIDISGGTFNLTGEGTVRQPANASERVIEVQGGTFNMHGGTITGGYGNGVGGGVYFATGTFNMYGGSITGNSVSPGAEGGGGVNIGGSITNNTSEYGGGVVVDTRSDTAIFIMKGGSISGNSSEYHGGGVLVSSGTFNWEGGIISGNTVNDQNGGNNINIIKIQANYSLNGRDSLFRETADPYDPNTIYLIMD